MKIYRSPLADREPNPRGPNRRVVCLSDGEPLGNGELDHRPPPEAPLKYDDPTAARRWLLLLALAVVLVVLCVALPYLVAWSAGLR